MILRITINVARAGVDASAACVGTKQYRRLHAFDAFGYASVSLYPLIWCLVMRYSYSGTAFGALGLAERASGANTQKPHTVYRQTRRRACKPHLPVYTHPTRFWIALPLGLALGCRRRACIRRGPTRTSCCCRRHTIPYSKFDIAHGRSLTRPGAEGHIRTYAYTDRSRSDHELTSRRASSHALRSRGECCVRQIR